MPVQHYNVILVSLLQLRYKGQQVCGKCYRPEEKRASADQAFAGQPAMQSLDAMPSDGVAHGFQDLPRTVSKALTLAGVAGPSTRQVLHASLLTSN